MRRHHPHEARPGRRGGRGTHVRHAPRARRACQCGEGTRREDRVRRCPIPAVSERQRKFFGAELGRARAGKSTVTGLGEGKLKEFATKPNKPNPGLKPTSKPSGGSMGFKRRKPKKFGLPNT